jgi:hypothetical protein
MSQRTNGIGQVNENRSGSPTFHLFPALPSELRLEIWKMAANTQRIVTLEHVTRETNYHSPGRGYPAVLAASRGSREATIPFFTMETFETRMYDTQQADNIYRDHFFILNCDDDIFYVHNDLICPSCRTIHSIGLEMIQRLAIPIPAVISLTGSSADSERLTIRHCDLQREYFWRKLAEDLPNLKELSLIFLEAEEQIPQEYDDLTEYWDGPSLKFLNHLQDLWSHALPEHEIMDSTIARVDQVQGMRGILRGLTIKFMRRKDWVVTHRQRCSCPSAALHAYLQF